MKYSKQELINKYTTKLVKNWNFVNYHMNKIADLSACYNVLNSDEACRKRFLRIVNDHLVSCAEKELNVLLVGFEAQEQDGAYEWTEEYYGRICHWLDELTARES